MKNFTKINPNSMALLESAPAKDPQPPLPWDEFVSFSMQVQVNGKVKPAIFDPKPIETADEAFQVVRILQAFQGRIMMAALTGKSEQSRMVAWETVPEEVRRHFCFQTNSESG